MIAKLTKTANYPSMSDFAIYFTTGWHHILSWYSFDHILFILALSSIYLVENWKQVLILVTAFTIGHSVTLALSVYEIVRFNAKWVEFLIPCTILTTSIFNFFIKDFKPGSLRLNYFLALFFGLIHGMGFANSIRFMLASDESIALPLISFNVGLEAGQIVIVFALLLLSYLFVNKIGFSRKLWIWGLSGIALIFALKMIIVRFPVIK